MKKVKISNLDNLVKIALTAGIVLVSFSIFYYLVVYIPQKEKAQLVLQQSAQEFKQNSETYEQSKELINKSSLNKCLDEVKTRIGKAAKYAAENNLNTKDTYTLIINETKRQNEECYKKYPQ